MPNDFQDDLFGVYVHWPFCKAKCPYCDFNSHVSNSIDHDAWAKGYEREIDYTAALTGKRDVTSIFFGGGTPSMMNPKTVEKIISHLSNKYNFSDDIEITLEANPTSIELGKFQDFKAAGVNRISVGIQSLRDDDLKFLGREHSAAEATKALKLAQNIFARVSYDLIYARPNQSVAAWQAELTQALELARGHLSLYQLTIEQGTPFYTQHARGDFRVPEADQAGEFYEATQVIMEGAQMPAYEVSNHAIAGQESRHNLAYWRYADYIGVGPGAHGRLTLDGKKQATRTHRAPDIWLQKGAADGHAYHDFEVVDAPARLSELMMMGLRLRGGVSFEKISFEAGQDWRMVIAQDKLQHLIDEGLMGMNKTHLYPTIEGMQRLNGILSYLL